MDYGACPMNKPETLIDPGARLEPLVIADYWAKDSVSVIADRYGLSKRRVWTILVQAGGKLAGSRVADKALEQAQRLADDGYSHTAIRQITGLSQDTVQAWFPDTAWSRGASPDSERIRRTNRELNEFLRKAGNYV